MFAICCIISLFIVAIGLVLSLLLVGESIYALVKRIERAGTMLMFGLISSIVCTSTLVLAYNLIIDSQAEATLHNEIYGTSYTALEWIQNKKNINNNVGMTVIDGNGWVVTVRTYAITFKDDYKNEVVVRSPNLHTYLSTFLTNNKELTPNQIIHALEIQLALLEDRETI